MKKIALSLALLAAFLLSALTSSGQSERTIVYPEAYYASLDLGAGIYSHNQSVAFSVPAVGLTAGWWISTPLALHLSADALIVKNAADNQSRMLLASMEGKWDANCTFFHVYNGRFMRPLPFYPLFGLGMMWNKDTESDTTELGRSFQAMVGLQVPMRINKRLSAKLEYKCYFLPHGIDKSVDNSLLHMVRLGVLFNGLTDPYHRRTEYETHAIGEDWFIGFGLGANYSAFDIFNNPNQGGTAMLGVAPEIMFGRNFSQFWTIRMQLTGLTAHEAFDTMTLSPSEDYKYTLMHFDVMSNLSHIVSYNRDVKWNFLPYLGAGIIWRYDRMQPDVAIDGGLFVRRYLGLHSDIYLDLKYIMISPSMGGGRGPSNSPFGVGIASLTAGYVYNFGRSTTRYRLPY